MSFMVAEPGPTTSEKRQTLLNKEQINDDEKRRSKATIDGEFKSQESKDQTMMKMMDFSVYDSSMEREHDDSDVSVVIKQMCAKSDIISRFVFHLSGLKNMIDKLQHEAECCMELVRALMRRDRNLNGMWEFETKTVNFNENMSNSIMLIPGVSSPIGTAKTSPEVIDEAGRVSLKLTLEASVNTETDRTTLQDTLEGMYDLDGININKDTLEEPKTSHHETMDTVNDQVIIHKMNWCTDVADDPNSVDSKELNCHDCEVRIRINKQNSDIAGDVHIGKGDPDDMCAMNEVQTKLLHAVQCHEAETLDLRQFEGMLQAREKQLENDVTGRVSESRKHCQLGTQFRDTASEHGNTHEHSMHSTRTENQCQDNARITTMTDERSTERLYQFWSILLPSRDLVS